MSRIAGLFFGFGSVVFFKGFCKPYFKRTDDNAFKDSVILLEFMLTFSLSHDKIDSEKVDLVILKRGDAIG